MIHLRDPEDLPLVLDIALEALIAQRFEDFAQGEPYDPELHAQAFLVQVGDSVAAIEAATRHCITSERFDVLEEHDACFELVFAEGDAGTVIFIPKADGIDADLITFCRAYAEPAPDLKAACPQAAPTPSTSLHDSRSPSSGLRLFCIQETTHANPP